MCVLRFFQVCLSLIVGFLQLTSLCLLQGNRTDRRVVLAVCASYRIHGHTYTHMANDPLFCCIQNKHSSFVDEPYPHKVRESDKDHNPSTPRNSLLAGSSHNKAHHSTLNNSFLVLGWQRSICRIYIVLVYIQSWLFDYSFI